LTPQARKAHQPRAASKPKKTAAEASEPPTKGDIGHNSIATVPIAMAPLARKNRPLLSMFGAKRFDLAFFTSFVFDECGYDFV